MSELKAVPKKASRKAPTKKAPTKKAAPSLVEAAPAPAPKGDPRGQKIKATREKNVDEINAMVSSLRNAGYEIEVGRFERFGETDGKGFQITLAGHSLEVSKQADLRLVVQGIMLAATAAE